LNPIENVWQIVKAIVANYPVAKSVEELEEQVRKAWGSVRPEAVRNLIESMPRCVQAVLQAKGAHTKYQKRDFEYLIVEFLHLSSNLIDVVDLSHFCGRQATCR